MNDSDAINLALLRGGETATRKQQSAYYYKSRQLLYTIETRQAKIVSPNHTIRPRQHPLWNRESDLLGGFQIDDQFERLRLLHGEIARIGAFQYFVHKRSRAPEIINKARTVGHKPSAFHPLCCVINRREPALCCKFDNLCSLSIED